MPTVDEAFDVLRASVTAELDRRTTLVDAANEKLGVVTADRDRIAGALAASEDELREANLRVAALEAEVTRLSAQLPTPTEIERLLAAGTHVTFESLMSTGDAVKITTDAQGAPFRAFGAGVMQAIVNRLPDGKGLIFNGYGTYEPNEPGWTNGDKTAIQIPKGCIDVVGLGHGGTGWDDLLPTTRRTVIRVKPMTGPEKNVLGAWFKLGYSGSRTHRVKGIHFEGTDQGMQFAGGGDIGKPGIDGKATTPRVFTNLFDYNAADDCVIEDVLSTGWSGTNGAPPGETFGVQFYPKGIGGRLERVYVDGRREKGGPIYGSAGITVGNGYKVKVIDCYAHHCADAGFVAYQSVDGETERLILGDPTDTTTVHVSRKVANRDWLNHERTAGWVHTDLELRGVSVGRPEREHISHSGDGFALSKTINGKPVSLPTANGRITLRNPKWHRDIRGGRLTVATWDPYGSAANSIIRTNPPVVTLDGAPLPFDWNIKGWVAVSA